ncbi:MAG TPA: [protein-PII] uridylyltransferase [Candidatus Binatia bacterium]|nr:[protein-PII] uridylyltransferase [Candidatus Binatia bacterium]
MLEAPTIAARDLPVPPPKAHPGGPPPVFELPAIAPDGEIPDVAKTTKEYLATVRSRLRAWHDGGAGGTDVVDRYTAAIDRLVCFLFDAATAAYRKRYVQLDQRCAVFAQGGYGRGELNPHSDIDLLFVYPHKVTPYVETVTEKILYSLWDTRLQVGHAVRNVRECVRLAATDLKIKTALIDARFVCGDAALAQELERALDREIKPRATQKFFREKLLESETRHHQYGDSVYLLEPQIKEGEGGLRDLHTALWVAKIKFKVQSLRELAVKGVMSAAELAELDEARDFLFRVRNSLHFLSGMHQDQLTFEVQERVAHNLGYRAAEGDPMKAVEHFLKDYYLHASTVTRFSQAIIDRSVNPPRPYRLIGRMMARTIRPGVQIIAGELNVTNGAIFEEDPTELVRLFADSQAHAVRLAPHLADLVRASAPLLDDRYLSDPRVADGFLGILRAPMRVYETLHEMHKLGVLARVIPEWAHLLCLVLHDFYHIYTVDEHSLMGVRELERLRSGERADEAPLLTQVMREVDNVELLFLGMLLHDSGKGLGGGHSEKGADFARAIAGRLGLNEDEVRELEFLVRNHLAMSHLSQRRDIHDDKLVTEFARLVGTPGALRRLYLLTYADMRATGPKVWNNWKGMLLDETYLRILEVFARGFEPEDRAARTERMRERVLAEVRAERGDVAAADCADFLATMPDTYFLTTPEALMPDHWAMVRRLDEEGGLVTSVSHHPRSEYSEFTVVTHDRPGLFATLTGVLAASGMNIVAARISTSSRGIVVDAFRVSHVERREITLDEARWQRTRDLLAAVLSGRQVLADLMARAERPGILDRRYERRVATEVVVDNGVSDAYTVLDIYTHDRVGLLHRIAKVLYELGLDIHLAKITTNVDQVLDVFYVTERDGRRSERVDEIRATLVDALAEPREDAAGSSDAPATPA